MPQYQFQYQYQYQFPCRKLLLNKQLSIYDHYIIESTNKFIPIGRPISNTQVYVLNEQQNIVPIGATGELYIGGAGLARGYLNQLELTNERFIENPFATPDDKAKGYNRLYKTGDLVRWAHDGNLEYLGRNDCQVKIRGYRIELGEIESALSALKCVKQAVVVDRENDGNKYLAAYLIKASGMGIDLDIEIDIEACRDSLALELPDYMIPVTFTVLDSIPLAVRKKLSSIPTFLTPNTSCQILQSCSSSSFRGAIYLSALINSGLGRDFLSSLPLTANGMLSSTVKVTGIM
jgi:acyl-CoA synthetase (AMP-forming)/AMP-acid ligase II